MFCILAIPTSCIPTSGNSPTNLSHKFMSAHFVLWPTNISQRFEEPFISLFKKISVEILYKVKKQIIFFWKYDSYFHMW